MSCTDGGQAFPVAVAVTPTGYTYSGQEGMSLRDYFVAHSRLTLIDARNQWYELNGRYGVKKYDLAELLDLLAQMRGMEADSILAERAR